LGGGTGQLEARIADQLLVNITVGDIYMRQSTPRVNHIYLDLTDVDALANALEHYDTCIISNALSPLTPTELLSLFFVISNSGVKKIIIYSAEDIRIVNAIFSFLKGTVRRVFRRKAMWLGYLYSGRFVKRLNESLGFCVTSYVVPPERGIFSQIWGSTYFLFLTRSNYPVSIGINKIDANNLRM
jgi:hypothetical protein